MYEVLHSDNYKFAVSKKTPITSSVSRFTLFCSDAQVKKFYPGLIHTGKSFSVTSLQNHISRYYTLCNCIGSLIYEEYKNSFSAAVKESEYKRTYNSLSEFNKKTEETLEIITKIYPQTDKGISKQLNNAQEQDRFFIHGPIGRGLQIDKYNSNGLHIIFVGGTGILPFMDLFAYIGRKLISENDERYSVFPDEQFVDLSESAQFIVYAYFPTRED
jgi:NAD(P)H-flavin reductase